MTSDGMILRALRLQLEKELPLRIVKINNISDTEILFQCKGKEKCQLLISAHSQYNHINLTEKDYPIPYEPLNFTMLLRKYLENGLIVSISQDGMDRYLCFEISGHDELGEKCTNRLYVELMGKYANIILVDQNNRIRDALKRIPPFENQRRTIQPGAEFTKTPSQEKKDPFTCFDYDPDQSLVDQFDGFSPLLAKEVSFRLHNNESFEDIMKEIKASDRLYVYENKGQFVFHLIPLKHLEKEGTVMELMKGMDEIYYLQGLKQSIRQQTGDLFKFVRKEIKKNTQKKAKLEEALAEARDCDRWRQYGDLLFANQNRNVKGMEEITLTDFDGITEVKIPLDKRYDARSNARLCFKKYNKFKSGQIHIQRQIDLCEQEIAYFQSLDEQLEHADFKDAEEIREELGNYGYIKTRTRRNVRKKKKDSPLNWLEIKLEDGSVIYVGKNNRQNEQLTFRKASRNDLWFHAQGYHGSHTILHTADADEQKIRLAAMLAAYYSKARQSSSIPVQYTPVSNVKKIPEAKAGMVRISTYKTIYMDIDKDILSKYIDVTEFS